MTTEAVHQTWVDYVKTDTVIYVKLSVWIDNGSQISPTDFVPSTQSLEQKM